MDDFARLVNAAPLCKLLRIVIWGTQIMYPRYEVKDAVFRFEGNECNEQ